MQVAVALDVDIDMLVDVLPAAETAIVARYVGDHDDDGGAEE